MSDDWVTVSRVYLEAVLAAVPSWVPEGYYGDSAWSLESLEAKQRLEHFLLEDQ